MEGVEDSYAFLFINLILLFVFFPATIFISMILIYLWVAAQERHMNRYTFGGRRTSSTSRNTIAARNRAAACSIAWLLSFVVFLSMCLKKQITQDKSTCIPFVVALAHWPISSCILFRDFLILLCLFIQKLSKKVEI